MCIQKEICNGKTSESELNDKIHEFYPGKIGFNPFQSAISLVYQKKSLVLHLDPKVS